MVLVRSRVKVLKHVWRSLLRLLQDALLLLGLSAYLTELLESVSQLRRLTLIITLVVATILLLPTSSVRLLVNLIVSVVSTSQIVVHTLSLLLIA